MATQPPVPTDNVGLAAGLAGIGAFLLGAATIVVAQFRKRGRDEHLQALVDSGERALHCAIMGRRRSPPPANPSPSDHRLTGGTKRRQLPSRSCPDSRARCSRRSISGCPEDVDEMYPLPYVGESSENLRDRQRTVFMLTAWLVF
jgi:hypothetical protein